MPQTLSYEEFTSGGAAPPQAAVAPATRPGRVARQVRAEARSSVLAMSTVISAKLSRAPRYSYTLVRLVVNLPMIPRPLFRPPPPFFDWSLASQDVLDRFSAVMTPLTAEHVKIFDACFYGWRNPTEAEQARLDEIMARCEIESALVERTLSGVQ